MSVMLISSETSEVLEKSVAERRETYCSGLFLSARWFVLSQICKSGLQVIVLPDKDSAEYCAADLYNLVEGDNVFFLPDSGKNVERSNYKSSLAVQRTAAVGSIIADKDNAELLYIVTYPEALEEMIPDKTRISGALLTLKKDQTISFDEIVNRLTSNNFCRVDFVSAPGQFAIRGSIIDIFSYSFNNPYRISFFGNEIEKINVFDCNTQLSKEEKDSADIFPDIIADDENGTSDIMVSDIFPSDAVVWLDSSDVYKERGFYEGLSRFRRVYIDTPLSCNNVDPIKFNIAPQPVFNKNFELLTEDIRSRLERGYRVCHICRKGVSGGQAEIGAVSE